MTKARLRYGPRRAYDVLHVTVPPEVVRHLSPERRWKCWVKLTQRTLTISADEEPGWAQHDVFTNVGSSKKAVALDSLSRSLVLMAPRWMWPRKRWTAEAYADVVVVGRQVRIDLPQGWSESCPAPVTVAKVVRRRGRPLEVPESYVKLQVPAEMVVKLEENLYLGQLPMVVTRLPVADSPPPPPVRVYTKLREEVRVNRPPAMVRGPSQDAIPDGPRDRGEDPRVVVAIPGDPPPGRSALDDRRRGTQRA